MTQPRHIRLAAWTLSGAIAITGLGLAPATAHAAPTAPTTIATTTISAEGQFGGLTHQEWIDVSNAARAAGDTAAAHAAAEAAGRADGIGSRSWTAIAKKAIKAALTYGRPYLPKTIRPWADKIVKVIDQMSATTEYGITVFLVQQGLPVDVARATAQWIVFFLI